MSQSPFSLRSMAEDYDLPLFFILLMIMGFGFLMVASASMGISDKAFSYPFHYLLRQLVFAGLGVVIIIVVAHLPIALWERYSPIFLIVSLGLLIAVLIPGISHTVNGSRRWISLGLVSVEVSEVIKPCFILYLARYISRYREQIQQQFQGLLKPIVLLGMIGVLLLMEPDFGSFTILVMTTLMILFLAQAPLLPFVVFLCFVSLALSSLAVLAPYRLERLMTFLHPWHYAFGAGYQLTQSLMAFGRGGLFGVGLGNSIQKLFYLPEAYTDFIFAIIGEELGLMGALFMIVLFSALIVRILMIGRRAEQTGELFSRFLCYGMGIWLSLQILVNLGVNTGLLPTKGLTLPFISYGGSSLLIDCFVIGLVMRVAKEQKNFEITTQHSTRLEKGRRRSSIQR